MNTHRIILTCGGQRDVEELQKLTIATVCIQLESLCTATYPYSLLFAGSSASSMAAACEAGEGGG